MRSGALLSCLVLVVGCGGTVGDGPVDGGDVGPDAGPPDAGPPDAGPPDAGPRSPICRGKTPGAYCGNDEVDDGDPQKLYTCPGPGLAPTAEKLCTEGCVVQGAGQADYCKLPSTPGSFRLPWKPGVSMQLTQDCNDSCCQDHIGVDKYAWDFAGPSSFQVLAARGGTVTHLKINSTKGCGSSSCVNNANILVIDHGDGTQSTYLHLAGNSLGSGVKCGSQVQRGQVLANAGTTGWSTGVHLHFEVSKVHTGAATCECGAEGTGCAADTVPWGSFWPSPTYPTVAMQFDEWPEASQCANRSITMPPSQNQ